MLYHYFLPGFWLIVVSFVYILKVSKDPVELHKFDLVRESLFNGKADSVNLTLLVKSNQQNCHVRSARPVSSG